MTDEINPFNPISDGQIVIPDAYCYLMKCCDCGLVHRMQFRAIEIEKFNKDGSYNYTVLDKELYRVEIRAWRHEEKQ